MRTLGLTLIWLIASTSFQCCAPKVPIQDYRGETESLLKQLIPVVRYEGQNSVTEAPSIQAQQDVQNRLIQMANQSPESRSQVIQVLMGVVEDPQAKKEAIIAYRWTVAVDVLGELKAAEAIDLLVKNINETGQNGICISLSYWPVASAIAKIGEPAIPQLLGALADERQEIRHLATITLVNMGESVVPKLEEALHNGSAEQKGGVALALAWIGSDEARAAIEHAIKEETDPKAKKELKDGLKEMRRYWGR